MNERDPEVGDSTRIGTPRRRLFRMGAALLVCSALATAFYVHSIWYPACCDARQYVEMARFFESRGLEANAPHADVRTFGYPLFVSLVSRAAHTLGIQLAPAVFFAQLALYLTCVVLLYRRLARSYGSRVGEAVYFGLVFNVLLLPYLALTLTDAFSVILFLFAAYVLIGLSTESRSGPNAGRAVVLGLIVGFAIVVRPANLWFLSLLVVGTILVFRKRRIANLPGSSAGVAASLFAAIALVAGTVALAPQSSLNWERARQLSPLPIYDLKEKQVESGLRHIKYSTNMAGTPTGLFYRNPLFPETKLNRGLEWYVREPLRGGATVLLRMYGGFDFDYLFPYVYDLRPAYRPVLFLISQFVVFFGLGGAVLLMFPALGTRILGKDAASRFCWKAPISAGQVFVPIFVAWAGIHGVSAMENRFALPMTSLMMPVAVAGLWAFMRIFRSGELVRGLWIAAGLTAWLALALPLATLLENSKQMP